MREGPVRATSATPWRAITGGAEEMDQATVHTLNSVRGEPVTNVA